MAPLGMSVNILLTPYIAVRHIDVRRMLDDRGTLAGFNTLDARLSGRRVKYANAAPVSQSGECEVEAEGI